VLTASITGVVALHEVLVMVSVGVMFSAMF
jgi:hypothetical protein